MADAEKKIKNDHNGHFKNDLPVGYLNYYLPEQIDKDFELIEKLDEKNNIESLFYTGLENHIHLKLYQYKNLTPLSDILPELDRLGIFVNDKQTFHLDVLGTEIWISDFDIKFHLKSIKIDQLKDNFKEALIKIFENKIESDRFNSLILSAQLTWQEVMVIRSYAKYLQQLGFPFSQNAIEDVLISHASMTADLIAFFKNRFNPKKEVDQTQALQEKILKQLDTITSLDQDRILRSFYNLISATVRTNYYQCHNSNNFDTLIFKFKAEKIQNLMPQGPQIDAYVYSKRFEAIHRRSSKIARGGIRWSDRIDFSTEILGLMRTQTVKNSVIIPTGAKGGFFIKLKTDANQTQDYYKEGVECYKLFISALLSITDNLKGKETIPPEHTICFDNSDPYLVVAADKGTANFSDIANEISQSYGFWLSDAFASGGKTGYNHKEMGITAKGAWEAVKRHFLELNINIYTDTFSAVGIGDMSGDVFGNGLLLSSTVKLIAAFDHRHIFLDPDPDPKTSFNERVRLFNLPTSSWQDYNSELISKGGGVFSRQAKTIPLSPEVKQIIGLTVDEIQPNELIKAILKAPVDLLWNGGIGTFVKASFEGHEQASDNTNRSIRINANELRCKVVGEGGNLGFTQCARIQYALKGGKINTDFIDNVGGVDCSDHEVNIKIALNSLIQQGKMSFEQRDKLLQEMQDEVSELVLKDCHNQALAISLIERHSKINLQQYQSYLNELEKSGLLDREKENLPDDEELLRRRGTKQGLLRPQISLLLAHTKLLIKEEILKTDIPDHPYLVNLLLHYFPQKMRTQISTEVLRDHMLKREINATLLSNDLVNRMGITYLHSLKMETGAEIKQIIMAYIIVSHIYSLNNFQELIESLNYKLSVDEQYDIFARIQELIRHATRWFLHNESLESLQEPIDCYKAGMQELNNLIPELMVGATKEYMLNLINRLVAINMPVSDATKIAVIRALYSGLNIIYIATEKKIKLERVANIYFLVGQFFHLVWFRDNLFFRATGDYWDDLSRSSLRNKFDKQQRRLTEVILNEITVDSHEPSDYQNAIEYWLEKNKTVIERWNFIFTNIQAIENPDLSMFFVAAQELGKLIRILAK